MNGDTPGSVDPTNMQYLRVNKGILDDAASSSDWASKKLVWIPNETEGFVAAVLQEEKGDDCVVRMQDTGRTLTFSRDLILKMNPPKYEKSEDMANLTYLHEASVLFNLKDRYFSGLIYTYSGLFCVVINPYKKLPIYSEEIVEYYKGKKRHERPPHIYAIADAAYRNMLQDREDQSILCTGESGAGKTENTKKVIQYLASVATSVKNQKTTTANVMSKFQAKGFDIGELEAQLLKANPILESFGNAKTIKNDNSSRFGKFIRINFDTSGFISGANIETYLLEKARVIRQAPDERCFHIFYQMLYGSSDQLRSQLLLDSQPTFRYLSNNKQEITGMDERQMFTETSDAMDIMGIGPEDQMAIFRVIAAVLHLGNIEFKQERNSDQASLPDQSVAQKVSHLLGLNVGHLTSAFLKPRIKVGREMVSKSQTKEQVDYAVEAISKAIYERLFKWLVARINKSLDREKRQGASFVGILDIAGFEIFDINSFEQLCINYTNEKLQQLFNHTMFELEQAEYSREGIQWNFIDFGLDLQPTIDLIEKPMGILSLLDEECFFPKATDKSFIEKLFKSQDKHLKLVKSEFRSNSDFGVVHYAGKVDYQAQQWLMKNMDPLNENVVSVLQASNDPLVQAIWKDADIIGMSATAVQETAFGPTRGVRRGMFRTVGQLYKESLAKLMEVLQHTSPNFVRCIIPNHEKKPGRIDAPLVLDQLKCNGVLEGIRICRQGFPSRVLFQEFRQRYEILTQNLIPKGFMDGRKAVEKMLEALDLDKTLYCIGHSKIFFKAGVLAGLEEDRDVHLTNIMIRFQACARRFLAKKALQKRIENIQAINIIQRNCVAYLKLRNWPWWRLFTKVKPLLSVTRQEELVAVKEAELRKAKDVLEKTSDALTEVQRSYEILTKEKTQLTAELQQERDSNADMFEQRQSLLTRISKLEFDLGEMEVREQEDRTRLQDLEGERKRFEEQIADLSEQLEQEEAQRQKAQVDKTTFETKLKSLAERNSGLEDKLARLERDKKSLEVRITDISSALQEEEERAKQLTKLKAKQETSLSELEERLSREQAVRQDAERAKRRLEAELVERNDQATEKAHSLDEFKTQLAAAESEVTTLQSKLDEEMTAKALLQKEMRALDSKVQELADDIEAEKKARDRAEEAKRDLNEELEAVRTELFETGRYSDAQQDDIKRHESELAAVRKKLEEEVTNREIMLADMKKKHQNASEQLLEQVETMKKSKQMLEKEKGSSDAQLTDLQSQVTSLTMGKAELEKRRRMAESSYAEALTQIKTIEMQRDELLSKLTRSTTDLEAANASLVDAESRIDRLTRSDNSLSSEVKELRLNLDEETKTRLNLQARLRQAEEEREAVKDDLEEEQQSKAAMERHVQALQQQMENVKLKVEEDTKQLESADEARKKLTRERDDFANKMEELTLALDKLEKSKRKIQSELEDANHALGSFKSDQANNERRAKKWETSAAEAQTALAKLQAEKDLADREARERETQLLLRTRELEEVRDALEDAERARLNLQKEMDEITNNKDGNNRNTIELEQEKIRLMTQVKDLTCQVEELEEEAAAVSMEKQRAELQVNALRNQYEHEKAQKDELLEEQRRQSAKKIRDLESELEDERKQRAGNLATRKKLEDELAEAIERATVESRQREELSRLLKKAQSMSGGFQRDLDEALRTRDEAQSQMREVEKKIRQLESERTQYVEDCLSFERQYKSAKNDLDELTEEFNTVSQSKNVLTEEKKRLELDKTRLEDELEEAQAGVDSADERYKRTLSQLDQAQADIQAERGQVQRLEAQRQQLERQLKDVRDKCAELEKEGTRRGKTQITALEAKLALMDEQLDAEIKERQTATKNARRLEKKIRDLMVQFEEERRVTAQAKEQLEKANNAYKRVKREMETLDDEYSNLKTQKRRLQRDLDDAVEARDAIERELNTYRAKLSRSAAARGRMSSASNASGTPSVYRPSTRLGVEDGILEDSNQSFDDLDSVGSGDGKDAVPAASGNNGFHFGNGNGNLSQHQLEAQTEN
ncbi:Myosin-10 [Cichlidogyrus casuarinus]|uniref:Myosin-10 n=1 Tax=Cichlidogyrus casuarinus TaxID=1844966 RepID=A0ABD2QR79_9PLAT